MMYFNLHPRYTPGSPATIWDRTLAEHFARQEREGYARALSGTYGAEKQEQARSLGLGGIVEVVHERGGGVHRIDMITGRSRYTQRVKAARLTKNQTILVDGVEHRVGRVIAGWSSQNTQNKLFVETMGGEFITFHRSDEVVVVTEQA